MADKVLIDVRINCCACRNDEVCENIWDEFLHGMVFGDVFSLPLNRHRAIQICIFLYDPVMPNAPEPSRAGVEAWANLDHFDERRRKTGGGSGDLVKPHGHNQSN